MLAPITIKPGGRCSIPDCCVFVDVEPDVRAADCNGSHRVHRFGVGVASCCNLSNGTLVDKGLLVFNKPMTFWHWLDEVRDRHKSTWVFAHNLGYDLTMLGFWDMVSESGDAVTCAVLDDPPTIITVRRGHKLIRFVDVLNYWRLSVSDLGLSTGLTRRPSEDPLSLQFKDSDRCKYHVEVIESCILRLIKIVKEMSLCSWRPTAASLSWGAFTKCFLSLNLHPHCNEHARRLERASYFGGRSEVRCTGLISQPVSVLDVNSLYPSVMASQQYPTELFSYSRLLSTGDLRRAMGDFDAIANVSLGNDHRPFPHTTINGVCYTTDGGEYNLAGRELDAAFDDCVVRRVNACCLYHRSDIFSSFVRHFYALKVESASKGDVASTMLWKLFLNSLHGKFAQRGRRWTDGTKIVSPGPWKYWWHRLLGQTEPVYCRSINGRVEIRTEGPEPKAAMPAVSSLVTANARTVLESYIQLTGYRSVLYCDTDSVHTLLPGRERLESVGAIDASKLGYLREVVRGDTARYWGHQHYQVGSHFVCSGIKPTAVQVSDGVYLQDAMSGVETVLQSGALDKVTVSDRVVHTSERARYGRQAAYKLAEAAQEVRIKGQENGSS